MTNVMKKKGEVEEELFQICDAAEGPNDAVEEIIKKFDLKLKPESVPSCGESSDIVCPFCGEKGFDKIGLKDHLMHTCEAYVNTENL